MVDMNTGYPANSLPDGVHPNQNGYVWMADVWYKAIKDLLP
jgi:lysophospholipase L1-like esterase